MADASIKLRLKATDAKRELADLRNDFSRTADAAGQMGGSMGGGGGGGGLGVGRIAGMAVGALLSFSYARGALGGARAIGQAATEGPSAIFEELLLDKAGANARGSLQALQSVKQTAGLAVGMGASPESFRAVFEALQDIEQKTERGQLELTKTFGADLGKEAVSDLIEALKTLPNRIADAITGIFG
jgi:hypothetical protein